MRNTEHTTKKKETIPDCQNHLDYPGHQLYLTYLTENSWRCLDHPFSLD